MPPSTPSSSPSPGAGDYAEPVIWKPQRPRFHLVPVLLSWIGSAIGLLVAAYIVPGDSVNGFLGALLVAALVAILNAIAPPIIAAIRLPYTVGLGFILVLALGCADAAGRIRDRTGSDPDRLVRLGAGNRASGGGGVDGGRRRGRYQR